MKSSVSTKTLQKDLQEARLEFEQMGADLGASKDQVAEVDNTLEVQEEEIRELQQEQAKTQVGLVPFVKWVLCNSLALGIIPCDSAFPYLDLLKFPIYSLSLVCPRHRLHLPLHRTRPTHQL